MRESVRAFLAVDLPAPSVAGGVVREEAPSHLTLAFLGDLEPGRVEPLVALLTSRLSNRPAFEAVLEGVGAFPDPRRPRVVWVGLTRGAPELARLAEEIRRALLEFGIPVEERPFFPHLTLFRVRTPDAARRARALLAAPPTGPLGRATVSEVLLKSSTLARAGAVHRIVARIPLARPDGGAVGAGRAAPNAVRAERGNERTGP